MDPKKVWIKKLFSTSVATECELQKLSTMYGLRSVFLSQEKLTFNLTVVWVGLFFN